MANLFSSFAAQLLGAFCGAVLVSIHFGPHGKETPDARAKLAIFCTVPAIRSAAWNFTSEVIGTLTLVFVVATIFLKGVSAVGPASGLRPYLVGRWREASDFLSATPPSTLAIPRGRERARRVAHRGKRRLGLALLRFRFLVHCGVLESPDC
jgi:glycerol uptake facilitator protein